MKSSVGLTGFLVVVLSYGSGTARASELTVPPDPGCEGFHAWITQSNPRSDVLGLNNSAYPEANATYWTTILTGEAGSRVTVSGRYPGARYMSFQTYDDNRHVLDALNDVSIDPDVGQNNPFRTGTTPGTYTVDLVFGPKPTAELPPNTIYTAGLTTVALVYRVYYANNPDDLAATSLEPILPEVTVQGVPQTSCPPRPIVLPEDAIVWGRLDNGDFVGTKPAINYVPGSPPRWSLVDTSGTTPYYPSEDNSYMVAVISREYLTTPHHYDLVVVRFRAPTFTDTQSGVPPYAPAQVRFWSLCQNEPLLTSVVRCLPDRSLVSSNGFVTIVLSDPSRRPTDDVLSRWSAGWLPWGALPPGDLVYDIENTPLTNDDGVFYYGLVLYRQTMADPEFRQSIHNVSRLPATRQKAAMGSYWPTIAYCTKAAFQAYGSGCAGQQ